MIKWPLCALAGALALCHHWGISGRSRDRTPVCVADHYHRRSQHPSLPASPWGAGRLFGRRLGLRLRRHSWAQPERAEQPRPLAMWPSLRGQWGSTFKISTGGLPRGRTHWLRSNNQPTAPAVTKAKIGSAPASTRATTTISIAIAIRNARTGLSMAAAATINHMTQEEVCLSEDRALTLTVGYLAPRRSVSRPTRVTCGARPLFTSGSPSRS